MAVHERKTGEWVLAVITGSEAEVTIDVIRYIKDYSPMGYATEVVQEPKDLGGGLFEAVIKRYASCN